MFSPLACRVCLSVGSQLLRMDKSGKPSLCNIYKLLSGLEFQVDICDMYVCGECEQHLMQAWSLHQKCVSANRILSQLAYKHSKARLLPEYLKQELDTWPEAESNSTIDYKSKANVISKKGDIMRKQNGSMNIDKHCIRLKTRRTIKEMDQYFSKFVTIYKMTQAEAAKDMERRRQSETFLSAPQKCLPCGRGFYRNEAFSQHLLQHDPDGGRFECDYCNIRCKTRHQLLDHFRHRHTLRLDCKKCSYSCNNRNLARQHESWHNGTLYKCKLCNEKFNQYAARQRHVKLHHSSEYNLDDPKTHSETITEAFLSNNDFANAIQKQKRLRPDMVCETCGKVFHTNWDFDSHRRKHTGEKPFECLVCHKKFALKGILKVHTRIHMRQKPFVCAVCGKDFSEKSNMLRHTQTHLDSKPIPCDLCEKEFKNPSSLKVHIKYVHMKRPYPVRKKEKKEHQKSRAAIHSWPITSE